MYYREQFVLDRRLFFGETETKSEWLNNFKESPKLTFITHGETASANTRAEKLKAKNWNAVIPHYLETFELFSRI